MTLDYVGTAPRNEHRVLLLPPTRRDAQITQNLLESTGLECHACESITELVAEVEKGVGAVVLTEEGVCRPDFRQFVQRLAHQPEWSDIPVVLMAKTATLPEFGPYLEGLTNVTFVERPASATSVASAVESAVRSRLRQYQVRDKVREISQAADQFEVMANSIPQLAWMSDTLGRVFWFNSRWFEYTGTEQADVEGWGWTQWIDPESSEAVIGEWKICLVEGVRFEREYVIRAADGSARTFLSQAEPIRDNSGSIARWLTTYTDIEEQRQLRVAREAMIEGERHARMEVERAARLKDEFLATLSHELRNPLSTILGWAYLLKKSPADPKISTDAGDVIGRSGESLKALVDDLLDLSRISSGKLRLEMDDVDLPVLVQSAVANMRLAADARSVSLGTDIEHGMDSFWGDAGRLQQIVANLLSNAIRFTGPGGQVEVAVRQHEEIAFITVTDNGEGIDPEFLPNIFDRFRQADASTARKHGGMGIGLSLVKQFAEMHGGEVAAASDGVGKGSTFTVRLPYRKPLSEADKDSGAEFEGYSVDLQGVSVLIVDDDSGVRDLLNRILSERGAKTILASSAKEAIAALDHIEPNILISDIGMPEKDGYELIKEVRAKGHTMPAIALTAFVRGLDRERAMKSGFQCHLTKPLEVAKLLEAVKEHALHR
jgi:PAS domain S-box-containing protein